MANSKGMSRFHPTYTGDGDASGEIREEIHGTITTNGEIVDLDNPIEASSLASSVTEATAITYKYQGELATGVVIPNRHPAAMQYLRDLSDYNNQNAKIKQQMELSRKLYVWEGIVGTVMDMFCDFSTTDVRIENIKDEKGKEIIEYFLKEVNRGYNNLTTGVISLSHMIAFCYFIDGNVFLYNKWGNTKYGKEKAKEAKLPMLLVPINPMIVDIPEDSIDFGSKTMQINLSSYYKNKTTAQLKAMSTNKGIPVRVRKALKRKANAIILTDDEIYHLKRRGTTFGAWGVPYLTRAFSAIASKRRLRTLDDTTTDGLINMITIFKVGDPAVPATLHPSRVQRLQSLLQNPTASMTLAWSYDIDVLQVGPKGEVLDFATKYQQVNYDVMAAMGVPISLLTGQGDKAGDIWVSMMIFMERLEECRHEIREYFRLMATRILEENGIYGEDPHVRTPTTKIRQEDVKTQILSLWDRGALSYDTMLEEAGFNRDVEYQKILEERKINAREVFERPSLPFDSPEGKPAERKTVDEKKPNPDRKTTKQTVDMKKKKDRRVEGSMEEAFDNFRWLRSKFTSLTKEKNINYAANWYAGRMKRLASVLDDYGYGIKGSAGLVTVASTSGNSVAIMNAIKNLENESMHAVRKYLKEAILSDEDSV